MIKRKKVVPLQGPLAFARPVWWLHPSALVCGVLIPIYLLLWWAGLRTQGAISTAKSLFFLEGPIAVLGLLGLLALALGTFSPVRATPVQQLATRKFCSPRVLTLLALLALFGYVYWFKDLILHPATLLTALKSKGSITYALRSSTERSAGLASMAQLGLPFLVLYSHARWAGGAAMLGRRHHWLFGALLCCMFFRAFAWGERVALIEAAIAIGFVWVSFAPIKSTLLKRLLPWLPLLGGVGVVLLFAAGEYFRSWGYYAKSHASFWDFILQRLMNYYFTALNTGAGILTMYDWPTYSMESVLRWLHKLPILGPIFTFLVHGKPLNLLFLSMYGDPEFNNPSGLFFVFSDLGIVGGLALFLLIGATAKYVYANWRNSATAVGAMYFVFLMMFMELFRYFYLGDPRCFMVVLGFALGALNFVEVNHETSIPPKLSGNLRRRHHAPA
ncbi:hypothetical protein ACXZ1M_21710 [Duganella sp. PWIR1]